MIDADSVDPMPENNGQPPGGESSAGDARHDGDAENQQSDRNEATQDQDDDVIEPLPGLPHEDYGREFTAPAPSAPMDVARGIYRLFRTDDGPSLLSWRGGWMRWDTTHWSELDLAQLRSHVYRSMGKANYEHVTSNGVETKRWNPDRRKVANVIDALDARAHFSFDIDPPSWIADTVVKTDATQIISCANGLLDLPRRTLIGHTPSLFNLVSVPFDYDPEAPQPTIWLEFLDSLWSDDPDSIMLLQEFFGYLLSGRTDMHKMLALIGPMRAGKGTIARALTTLIGKGNVAGPTLSSLGTNFGLSPLLGKPVAIISDARLGSGPSHTVVERLLSITGEDMLTIDRKYREPWTGRLPTRFVMLSNELPRFTDSSGAIATRMLILQLTKSFLNREDRTIESRLLPDMPGILNWALDGLDRLIANGRFTVPGSSEAATTMMMDLASPVSAFVRERCERGPNKIVDKDSLYFSWKLWAESNGHHAGAKITFGRSLHAAVPGLGRADIPVGDKRVHGYRGIGLLGGSDYPENNSDHPAQPAQDGEPASRNRFDGQHHSAQTATSSSAADKPLDAAQDDAQGVAGQNRTSRATAQDVQDETRCRSTNGHQAPLTIVPPTQEQAEPDEDGKSVKRDFAAVKKRYGIEPGDDRANLANITVADDKSPAPVRINGRPVDRSAHYKAPGRGGKRRRNR
jgi:putative DNA primase/helicase